MLWLNNDVDLLWNDPITLQRKDITIQVSLSAAELSIQYLQRLRSDNSFDAFYDQVVEQAKELTDPPVLPSYGQPPTPKCYFRKQYFEVLELLINELKGDAYSSSN